MSGESATGSLAHRERRRLAWITAALFAALTAPRLLTLELWRDEARLWLVVTESANLSDLGASLARSGQGYLFPLLCYFAGGLSSSPVALQCVNLALAVAGAVVFVRWAPLRRSYRLLFVLGYLPFYEYAVITRHYAAGVLLLWLACAAIGSCRPALGLGAALGLLCQTTVYGFILAAAVAAGWLVDRWRRRGDPTAATARPPLAPIPPIAALVPIPRRAAAAGLALALGGAAAGLFQLIPDAGTSFARGWRFDWQPDLALRVLQTPWRAFALLPRPGLHFWNSNLLDPWPTLQAMCGLLILLGTTAFVWPRKAALATWLIGAAGFVAFGYIKYIGALRHDGHWWLLFLAALWVGGGLPVPAGRPGYREERRWRGWRTPAIRDLGLDRLPLLGYREPPAATVALALGRPLFAPSRERFVTHPDWGPGQRDLTMEELRCASRALAARERGDVGLVLSRELPAWKEIEPAGATRGAIQASEDYFLYRLNHSRLPQTAAAARCPESGPESGH